MIKFNIINEKNTFEEKLSEGIITDEHVSFIKDSGEIYTHGHYWGGVLGSEILIQKVTSDADGKIAIPTIDGYLFMEAVSFDNGLPLNVIRFGDYFYVGYYGGQSVPNSSTAVTLMFTSKAYYEVVLFYIKNTQP